ncbi:MAG: type II toxin-antitoxin system RelE/ParE family toxin [Burkholderiales bacterium]|nr:type II toxin-antitoxin system RelE/ParE family toxin [Phycisphaerae bacterium]
MDGYRVIISPAAAHEIEAIHAWIAQDSPQNARQMVAKIFAAIDGLQVLPHRNVVRHLSPRLRNAVRSLPVRPYVMYFRIAEDDRIVYVLTLRHGARRKPRF